jgi:tetratricopeptide (TPR) repeat protein
LQECYDQLQDVEALRLSEDPDALNNALIRAEDLVRRVPDYWGAQHTLGLIYTDLKDFRRALSCLACAAMLNPASSETLIALTNVYLNLGAIEIAQKTIQSAVGIDPDHPGTLCMLGEVYKARQDYVAACEAYRQAIAIDPRMQQAILGLGVCLSHIGDDSGAAALYEGLLTKEPGLLDPLYELASLPPSVITIDLLAELETVTKDKLRSRSDFDMTRSIAKGMALHASQRYAEAWPCFTSANRAIFRETRQLYKAEKQSQVLAMTALENSDARAEFARSMEPGIPASLFILGASRSGKTSIEQLLGGCDAVTRGFESTIVERSVKKTMQEAGLPGVSAIDLLPRQLLQVFREHYLRELNEKAANAGLYTITNPRLVKDAVGILSSIPNARILMVQRDIEDNIFSIYTRLYQNGNLYSYNLNAARDHVSRYHSMIDILAKRFPENVRVTRYEDAVGNPASVLALVSELCGIDILPKTSIGIVDDRGCSIPYRQLMAGEAAISMI